MPNIRRGMMAAAGAGGGVEYELWAWGNGGSGTLGNGEAVGKTSPIQIGDKFMGEIDVAGEGIIATGNRIDAGGVSSAAIKGDGTLWTWGSNTQGKLGIGDTTSRSSPVQVGSLTDWRSILVGWTSMCATKTDGTLWGWGNGDQPDTYPKLSGQQIDVSSPVQIGSDTDWTGVLAINSKFANAALGLKTDGQMYMWGSGITAYWTQAGFAYSPSDPPYSNALYSRYPTAIDDKSYVNAGCGNNCVLAIEKDTGKLWAWGYNNYGQLGNGTTTSISSPVQIGSATDWLWTAGDEQGETGVAANTNGEIWGSGRQEVGALGLENKTGYCSPVQVGGPGGWSAGGHGMAGRGTLHDITDANGDNTGGALWACGDDFYGILGNGGSGDTSSPIQIGTDTTWVALNKQASRSTTWKLAIKQAD